MLRRSFLSAVAAIAALPVVPRPTRAAIDPGPDRAAVHVLNRLAFGPSRADLQHIRQIGVEHYIAEQLHPDDLPEPPELGTKLGALTTTQLDPVQLFREYGPTPPAEGAKPDPDARKARRQRANIILFEAMAARVWRALSSPRQLQEAMVDFWYNHFNVFALKALDHLWIGAYERDAIRPHALGRFRDLLGATAHHPAMLYYLDNVQNVAPGTKGPKGQELGINENYARELMELHTLGVDGGYTQDDVIALARILTGWSLMRPRFLPPQGSGFEFYPARHDSGAKHFLGQNITANGAGEGEAALDMLAKSPATARHVATKLVQYFVADQSPPALVAAVAQRFQDTDGDIRAVLAALFASPEFRNSAGGKYKSPYRYVLSAARAAGVEVNNPRPLLGAMARQGQPLYRCVQPDGFKDSEDAWLSPDATMLRISFATGLGSGHMPLQAAPQLDQPPVQQVAMQTPVSEGAPPAADVKPLDAAPIEALLAPVLGKQTREAVASAQPPLRAALILGSPDFMRR